MAAPRSDNVKEIILAKTSELMEETGLSSISLASIAEACGISKGTLYYHYKTKEDIFFDLIERHFREQEQELIAWMDDLSKDVSVNRLLMYVLDRNNYEGALRMQVLSAACFGNEDVRRKVLDIYDKFRNLIVEKLLERDDCTREDAEYIAWMSRCCPTGSSCIPSSATPPSTRSSSSARPKNSSKIRSDFKTTEVGPQGLTLGVRKTAP